MVSPVFYSTNRKYKRKREVWHGAGRVCAGFRDGQEKVASLEEVPQKMRSE